MEETISWDVLLVDDSESDAELTTRALKKFDASLNIKWFRDGPQLIECLRNGNFKEAKEMQMPGLIIMDLKMPKMTGIELMRVMRHEFGELIIPVVLMSSSREPKDLKESYQAGINSYVVKPLDFDEFNKTVRIIGEYWLQVNEAD